MTSPQGSITASIGVAVHIPGEAMTAFGLVSEADAALYRAKAGGRDRVELAPVSPAPGLVMAEI